MKPVPSSLPKKAAQTLVAIVMVLGLLALPAGASAAGPSFAEPTATAGIPNSEIWGMDSGDLDGDSRADVVTASLNRGFGPAWVGVQFAAADGSLEEPVTYTLPANGATSVTLGDFDEENGLDIVALSDGGATLLLNDGTGAFTAGAPLPGGGSSGSSAAAGDFNLDDHLDLIIIAGPEADVYLGDGDGTFDTGTSFGFEDDSWGNTVAVADFEGDGSADLGVTQYDTEQTEVFTSNDDGTFTSRGSFGTTCGCGGAWGLAAADLDRDGGDDLVVGERWANRIYSIMAGPDDTFTKGPNVNIPDGAFEANPIWVATGDLNGDGYPDVATSDYMNDSMTVFVGDGTGGFAVSETLLPTYPGLEYFASHANVIDDFDGDGRLDLAVGSQMAPVVTYLNDGEPVASAVPESVDFGSQPTGFASAPTSVHVENDGNAVLEVSAATVGGTDAGAFAVDASDCLDQPALAGAGCDLEVTFAPTALGAAAATLTIESDDPGGDLEVSLSGTGIAPMPEIAIDPSTIDFGPEKVGAVSPPETITIANDGFAPLQVSSIALAGADATDFDLDPAACPTASIPVGGECEFRVAFEPLGVGSQQAEAVVASNDPGGPAEVSLAGSGIQPGISIAPAEIEFADQAVGTESEFVPFTIENQGDAALELTTIEKAGPDAIDFSVYTAECATTTLGPGESCKVWASFRPSGLGVRFGFVTVNSDDPGGSVNVPLNGTATGSVAPAQILVSPGLIGFGGRRVGTASPPSAMTITNIGDAPLAVGSATIGGDAPGDYALGGGCPNALAFAESCQLSVTFTATATGARSATLTIPSSAPGGPVSVALSGAGFARPLPVASFAKPPKARVKIVKVAGRLLRQSEGLVPEQPGWIDFPVLARRQDLHRLSIAADAEEPQARPAHAQGPRRELRRRPRRGGDRKVQAGPQAVGRFSDRRWPTRTPRGACGTRRLVRPRRQRRGPARRGRDRS